MTTTSDKIKRMDMKEFQDGGYLQEANRRFFHPLGLALEVMGDDDEDGNYVAEALGGVWDYRDDPEGMRFGKALLSPVKAEKIDKEWEEKEQTREENLGYMIQPATQKEYIPSLFSVEGRWECTLDYAGYAKSEGDPDRWPVHLSIEDADVIDDLLDSAENVYILLKHPHCDLELEGEMVSRIEIFTRFMKVFENYQERKRDE